MRCRTGACIFGCGNETWAFACLGGDSTLLSAATAGHQSKGGRLTAGGLLGLPLNAVLFSCIYFIDCFFPLRGGDLAWFNENNAAQPGA